MDIKMEVGGEVKHVVQKDEKQNSFEFRTSGTGNSIKVYYKSPEDLEEHLKVMAEKAISLDKSITSIKEALKSIQ